MNDNLSAMKTKRRDFLKFSGVAGMSWVGQGAVGRAAEAPMADQTDLVELGQQYQASHKQRFNMAGYAAPKIEKVRIGIIGLGNRGPSHLDTWPHRRRRDRALCDLRPERVKAAAKQLKNRAQPRPLRRARERMEETVRTEGH